MTITDLQRENFAKDRTAKHLHKLDLAQRLTAVQPRVRKTLSGQTVPRATEGRTWNDLILPCAGRQGLDPNHPSRKHDIQRPAPVLLLADEIGAQSPGLARRRDRRNLARLGRRHFQVAGSAGGDWWESECNCGAVFTAPTGDLLSEATAGHYRAAAILPITAVAS